jgi:transposase-like protein
MVSPDRDKLHGTVEVDETFWGAARPGKRGRGAEGKSLIFVAVEHTGNTAGRIRLQLIPNATAETLVSATRNAIASGSVVETDGLSSYNGLTQAGFQHMVIRTEVIDDLLPHVHVVASLLKRWLLGTHHGAVRPSHMEYYLDEFTFRFNRRTARSRGLLFLRVLENAVRVSPVTETDLFARVR